MAKSWSDDCTIRWFVMDYGHTTVCMVGPPTEDCGPIAWYEEDGKWIPDEDHDRYWINELTGFHLNKGFAIIESPKMPTLAEAHVAWQKFVAKCIAEEESNG